MRSLVDQGGVSLGEPGICEHIYSNTAEGSLLRAVAADTVVQYYSALLSKTPKQSGWSCFLAEVTLLSM